MHANNFSQRLQVDSSNVSSNYTAVFTDKLHGDPFKNLTVWVRSLDPLAAFTYTVYYGGTIQVGPPISVSGGMIQAGPSSVAAGKVGNYTDTQIQPPNQPNSNWSTQPASSGGIDTTAVGVPINVLVTNTGSKSAVFLVSFVSESYGQVVG